MYTVDAQAEYPVVKDAILNQLEVIPDVSQVKLRRMKFRFSDDIGDYVTSVRTLAKRWLIPEKDPNETNADLLKRVIDNVVEELTMEHVQSRLPKELQERINARGPTSVNELQQCIREFRASTSRTSTQTTLYKCTNCSSWQSQESGQALEKE